MYSPKIKQEFIPILFKISASKGIPMTRLINQIIKDYLEKILSATHEDAGVRYEKRSCRTEYSGERKST